MHRLGAVALKRGRIINTGFNQLKTHTRVEGFLHAECHAVIKAGECDTIIVVRVSKSGNLLCSKPCDGCQRFLKKNKVKTVYYINWESQIQKMNL